MYVRVLLDLRVVLRFRAEPRVKAPDGSLEMSEYDRFKVLGRNCRYLPGRACAQPARSLWVFAYNVDKVVL